MRNSAGKIGLGGGCFITATVEPRKYMKREAIIMPTLTPEEQEIMRWGADSIKAPWLALCEIFAKMNSGEKLSRD